jgi:hypothetical protein
MTIPLRRVLLVFLLISAFGVGSWAYFAPMSWYTTFPGFGLRWLPPLGPFNEHFVKDVGAMFLGLAVLSVGALAMVVNDGVVRLVAATWLTFNTFHFVYHLQMLHVYGTLDKVLNVIVLGALLLASAALLAPVRHGRAVPA